MTTYGTSHFPSISHAVKYYKRQHETADDVRRKIKEGLINIGPPTAVHGESVILVDDGLRYAIQTKD
jgi:hypothetical protein